MSQVENLTVYFVLKSDTAGEGDSSSEMRQAYNTVLRYGANAKWIKPSSCFSIATSSKDVFVFEKFEGQAFDDLKKHSAKYVILGVRCILTCISNGRSIPSSPTPVFSEGMRDLVICCSGFDSPVKKQLQEKVEYMAGIYVKSLRAITTHVVAYNNISPKAIEAYKSNLPIMKYEWIEAVWEKSKHSNVNGKDDEFKSFISPLFHNLKVTTSGIDKKEKEKIKELIEEHGGSFSGTLQEKNTNVLILSKPEGEKFKFAKSWSIPCVKPSWVYDSVDSKVVCNLSLYGLESKVVKSSTPKKDAMNFTANFSMMSAIAQDTDRMITHLEETHTTLSLDNNMRSEFATPKKVHPADNVCDVINNVLLKNLKDAGQFLDGCNIYLCGFNGEDMEKLKKVLNFGGATRFSDLNEFVTHVIIGRKTESLLATLKNVTAHVVSVNWLAESMKLKRPASEGTYSVLDNTVKRTEPPSPLSKLGAKLLTTLESKEVEKPQFDLDKENEKLLQLQEEELLNKYKQSQPGEPLTPRENPLSRTNTSSLQSRTGSLQQNAEFFKGLSFFLSNELIDRERKELEEIITAKGGQVVGKRFFGIPDYAIVPITGATLTEITTKEVVNVFFVKDCYFEDSVVNLQYYHYPVACVKDSKPLKDCVISVSNYIQCEREFIEVMIEVLGATPQSLLARKPKENILKSTHLICSEATGQKYSGAIRWGLPVVHHDWLLKCAAVGMRVSEQPYLIGESKSKFSAAVNETRSNRSKVDDVERRPTDEAQNKSADQQTLTQLKSLCKSTFKTTPVHSAVTRLKNNETPKSGSPDLNRTQTPTSPYGAFYGNENPSPGTRKRLWKWMNQGADFPQDPPTSYPVDPPRRDSTPLSEVLSKFLVQMKRKPEEIPTDSPVSTNKRISESDGVIEIPVKKLNLGDEGVTKEANIQHNSVITTGLQKMKEIEENYTKNCVKPLTPVRKQSDSVPQMLVVTESQPHTEVGWEDPNEKEIALKKLEMAAAGTVSEKIFMITRLSNAEDVGKLIEECGGKVSPVQYFDKNATHLISMDLTRDEKLMASISAGLWVLHPSYVDELQIVRDVHKIPEELFEWGNPSKRDRIANMPSNAKTLAACSMDWRLAIKSGAPPAFKDMKIILHLRPSTYDNFRRLVEAGGGQVVQVKPPYKTDFEADICVVDPRYNEEINFEAFAVRNIPCVTILYLNDRILKKEDAIDKNIAQPFLKYWKKKNSLLKYVNADFSRP